MAKIKLAPKGEPTEEFRQWNNLIEQIATGNVIPVIGPDFMVDDADYPDTHNANTILLSELSQYYQLPKVPKSFSELFFELNVSDKRNFYLNIGEIFDEGFELQPSRILEELLSIRQFPFVITTSFMPVVENAMRKIWGDGLKVMNFCNNPQRNDDLRSADDIKRPTVFYMFGKVSRVDKTYVLTDTDMLTFCKSWLTPGTRPGTLSSILQNKYPLFLGTNYSDWLCRFVWFSLKSSFDSNPGMMVDSMAADSLLQFLKHIDAFTQNDPGFVISEIKRLLDKRLGQDESLKFGNVLQRADVFISYSRSDSEVADKLYKALTEKGVSVWYDKLSLGEGDKFMREIRQGIRTSRFFVPIITSNVEAERNDPHVYRQEWQTAIERAEEYGRTFILPLTEEGFDFYSSSLPEKMMQHNAVFYNPTSPDFSGFADKVVELISNLKS